MLDAMKVSELAHALYRAHGDTAEAEAAKRARESREKGDGADAENWTRVRAAIHQLRGPRQK